MGDNSAEATIRKGIRLTSQVPSIVCAHQAIRNEREVIAPSTTLGHAANFLYMLSGEEPSADSASLMDTDMVLHAEHGSSTSSFTARCDGTDANLHGSITAAIAALSRPAHGGAAENVMKMAQEVDRLTLRAALKASARIVSRSWVLAPRLSRGRPTSASHA